MTITFKSPWGLYRGGEEPQVGDLVRMEGAFWNNNANGHLAVVIKLIVNTDNYVVVRWLEEFSYANSDVWPKYLMLVRRNPKLVSWI